MKLKLDLDGILFRLEIIDYQPSTENDDKWCEVSYSASNDISLNYGMRSYDNILCSEVEELRDTAKKLLLDELTVKTDLSFIESGLSFCFIPKVIDNQITLLDPYPQVFEAYAELKISFWDDRWTNNYLSLHLGEEEIEYIKNYLNLVTGVVDKTNPVIEDMINRKILVDVL